MYLWRETQAYRRNHGWGHYNEFLIDGHSWDDTLPWSVEAFMSSSNGGATSERAHAAFVAKYNLKDDDVPLLTMTPSLDQPFTEGSHGFGSAGDPTRGAGRCRKLPCNSG